ncbi:hypothetical protein ABIE09_003462 [Lysobacter enzymogenes]|uniref:DUF2971 domain-containing protein n=1 Tax=Lysobacter enzymogenes TaxID=69 RepID=UPI0033962CB7
MSKKIYKYVGPGVVDLVLSGGGAVFKCSKPEDFNDPYELFLTVDFSVEPEALACYQEIVGNIPQLPTTCFSKSPSVIPMWAHYAQNVTGFVVEVDEERLKEHFPESSFNDVAYMDAPGTGLTEMLYRAHVIGKPRYVYMLQGGAFYAAYFTKASCWSYEAERRMVVSEKEIRASGGLLLLDVPGECITAIIAGARAGVDLIEKLKGLSDLIGCDFFKMEIGRTTVAPFFKDSDGASYVFDGAGLAEDSNSCDTCGEPISKGGDQCSWCQITEQHQTSAAIGNPYRMLNRIGRLDAYVDSMDAITKRHSRREE